MLLRGSTCSQPIVLGRRASCTVQPVASVPSPAPISCSQRIRCRTQLPWSARNSTAVHATTVDPLAVSDGIYRPGQVQTVPGPADLNTFLDQTGPHAGKLIVFMAKSSHCRPCKKFAATYHSLASSFKDCCFLDIMGDASPENRKMMMDMKVKVTPSFFLYRGGQQVHTFTGTGRNALARAIVGLLRPGEAGADWKEPVVSAGADSDDDE